LSNNVSIESWVAALLFTPCVALVETRHFIVPQNNIYLTNTVSAFTALPLYSMTPSTQTISAVTSSSGYIMSHKGFNIQIAKNYGKNLHKKLNLTDFGEVTGIHVEFIDMAIGSSSKCGSSGDEFRLSSKSTDNLYSCRDIRMPPPPQYFPINSAISSLLFSFTTDSLSRFNGFLLKYTSM